MTHPQGVLRVLKDMELKQRTSLEGFCMLTGHVNMTLRALQEELA